MRCTPENGQEECSHEQGDAGRSADARSRAALVALGQAGRELRGRDQRVRGSGAAERTEYHNVVAWDRLAEICGQFLSKGQLIDIEGRLQTRQWDDDAGVRHWKTEVVIASLEMLSGRGKKEYAKEAQAVATAPDDAEQSTNGAAADPEEVLVAM